MPPRTTAKTKAASIAGGLSPEERDALLAELTADPTRATAREALSPRERVIASLLRDRDHLDGCPVYEDELGGARCEAYDERRPANVATATPARPIAVLRCLECGGTRYMLDRTVAEVLTAELESEPAPEDLDGAI